jgi:Family of unknown function (DUF5636)
MSISANEIQALEKRLGNISLDKDTQFNWAKILAFFTDKAKVHHYLNKFAETFHKFDPIDGKKSFRAFFKAWGDEYGFNQGADKVEINYRARNSNRISFFSTNLPNSIPSLVGIVPANLFVNVFLRHGYLICDPGAGTLHGKWTHTLQVFMLQEALNDKVLQLKGCDSIRELYQNLAKSHNSKAAKIFGELLDSELTADYTKSENLHRALMTEIKLTPAVKKVREKINRYDEKIQHYKNSTNYCEKKVFPRANLYMGVKNKVCGFLWGKSSDVKRIDVPYKESRAINMLKRLANISN